jgi:chaperone BCS1
MDNCYYSLIKLFETNGIVHKARSLRLVNGKYGGSNETNKSIGSGTHYFIYKGYPITIDYTLEKTLYNDEKVHISLTKPGRSHKLFDELMKELADITKADENSDELFVYSFSLENHHWQKETAIRKRSFDTIFIEDGIKNKLLNHLDKFYSSENWYHERGIPYQTGICLHGPAGTGKTSIVKGLASYYNKNLCILRSSEIDKLPIALKRLPEDSFIVIEDIDTSSIVMERNPEESLEEALYNLGKKVVKNNEEKEVGVSIDDIPSKEGRFTTDDPGPAPKSTTKSDNPKVAATALIPSYTKVLLSDVLNAMDGLISIEKRVIIFTTNHLDKLDRALIRPGRIDCLERIDYISYSQFERFCRVFYKDHITESEEQLLLKYSGFKTHVTVAELQRNFMQGMGLGEMIETYCE